MNLQLISIEKPMYQIFCRSIWLIHCLVYMYIRYRAILLFKRPCLLVLYFVERNDFDVTISSYNMYNIFNYFSPMLHWTWVSIEQNYWYFDQIKSSQWLICSILIIFGDTRYVRAKYQLSHHSLSEILQFFFFITALAYELFFIPFVSSKPLLFPPSLYDLHNAHFLPFTIAKR